MQLDIVPVPWLSNIHCYALSNVGSFFLYASRIKNNMFVWITWCKRCLVVVFTRIQVQLGQVETRTVCNLVTLSCTNMHYVRYTYTFIRRHVLLWSLYLLTYTHIQSSDSPALQLTGYIKFTKPTRLTFRSPKRYFFLLKGKCTRIKWKHKL